MSDTSTDSNPLAKGKLGRKFFGAPLYMILLVVVAVVAYYWYKKRKTTLPLSSQLATAVGSSEAANSGMSGSGGSASGGTVTTPNGSPGITTNSAWSLQVSNSLIGDGSYSPTDVSNAISKYLNGQQLTAQEQAIINIALQRFGIPPEGVLPVVVTPPAPVIAPPPPPPPPAPAAPAPPAPATHYYTVVPGDNLTRIAIRFYGAPAWQKIYNANRGVIGGNPNLIRPGQQLVIPA